MRITETQIRKVIRKMILEVTGAETEKFTSLASSVRGQDIAERDRPEEFKKGLGSSDKEITLNLQKIHDLLVGGKPLDPQNKEEVNTLLLKALAKLR